MPGVPKKLIEHSLNVYPQAVPKKQRLRRFAPDKREAIKREIAKLLVAGFIKEVIHPEWVVSVFNRLPTEGYTQGGKFWVRRRRDQELEGARNTRLLDRFGPHGA
jgi:hypothetical protein